MTNQTKEWRANKEVWIARRHEEITEIRQLREQKEPDKGSEGRLSPALLQHSMRKQRLPETPKIAAS